MILTRLGNVLSASIVLATWLFVGMAGAQHKTLSVQEKPDQLLEKIVEVELTDGERIKGRLCLPARDEAGTVPALVVYVHGTGPGTYLNKRKIGSKTFNYFDFLAKEFCDRGLAFFSYNKRGVTMGEKPPWYDQVDREKFRRVVPSIESQDLATIVDLLQQDERLTESNVVLLGWSEGTMVAALAAEKYPEKIDALFLCGYAHENLFDIIATQYSGHGSMLNLNPVFDANGDKKISKEEYESDEKKVARYRKSVMQNAKFELLDATKDELLDAQDFAIRTKPVHEYLLECIANGNEDWIWNNYFRISIPWLQEHFSLEPNKTRLTRMDLPIYIFHGTDDPHVLVQGVHELEKRFRTLGKTNLRAFVFKDHDHDLNFLHWALKDKWPDGWAKIMEIASGLSDTKD